VNHSYRLGILIVVATLLISFGICLAWVDPRDHGGVRAGQDLGPGALALGEFQLRERSGHVITQADLAGRVCIASFIFTRCPLSCPRITTVVKGLQSRLRSTNVLLLSISVDPEHDTPAVLAEFARRYDAAPDRWWFLTGPKASIYDLVRNRFRLALQHAPTSAAGAGSEAISHSDRLALLDRGKVVGFFDSTDPQAVVELAGQARRRALPAWIRALPGLNATLNALCAAFLIAGWITIRRRRSLPPQPVEIDSGMTLRQPVLSQPAVRAHRFLMALAVTCSSLFLTSYLFYHQQAGSVPFRGGGVARLQYFTILLSHTILASFGVVPLVILTLVQALRGRFDRHLFIARITFPIWIYVSITGVLIYLMLYHLVPDTAATSAFSWTLPQSRQN
jgi:protein SCO1/2/putative membrane protein